jgi:CRISPR-associated protein Cas5t
VLILYVQAPFAAFRTFTAGWYRPTAAFLTPSAAYGLTLNIAGVESRRDDGIAPMTLTAFDLPAVRIAIGADPDNPAGPFPPVHTLFQQLHNYPVGASGKERKEDAKGNKYNITPVRREFLAGLRAFIAIDGNEELEGRARAVLAGEMRPPRYGLPFLGDNAFLLDRVEVRDHPVNAFWYRKIGPDDEPGLVPHITRLTSWIDRQDMSRTLSDLYAPIADPNETIPEAAWTSIDPPKAPPQFAKPRTRKG